MNTVAPQPFFRVLGPLSIELEGRSLTAGGAQRRAVLALLVLERGRSVSSDRIILQLWGDRVPASAKTQLHGHLSALRRSLGGPVGGIVTTAHGYLLEGEPHQVDAELFSAGAHRGHALLAAGDAEEAATELRKALGHWRGPAYADVSIESVRAAAERLEEDRLLALQDRVEADLALGRHAELIGELEELVAVQPLREALRGSLMVALARSGRRADALGAYRQWRALSIDEHGCEPSAQLQSLHEAILRDENDTAAPRPTIDVRTPVDPLVRPAQLPIANQSYVGRQDVLDELNKCLSENAGRGPAIAAIVGPAGVGKTALATHWAHGAADRFPDGQLYLDLHGYSPSPPMTASQALVRLLRSLGARPDQIPLDEDEAASRYRTLLAQRKVLVFLDNASSTAQLRPLLPPGTGSMALITSRDRLTGLVAAHSTRRLPLAPLSLVESRQLVGAVLGERAAAEPAALDELCDLCDRWPLALRIAAANLHDNPYRSISSYNGEVSRSGPLRTLSVAGEEHAGVKVAFDLSYEGCRPEAQRAFRLLGLTQGPDISSAAAARLLSTDEDRARQLLDLLASAHLVEHSGPDRYRLHDLIRTYAYSRAVAEETSAGRTDAIHRLLNYYVDTTDAADRLIMPLRPRPQESRTDGPADRFDSTGEAVGWLESERGNLLAATQQAQQLSLWDLAWKLPAAGLSFYYRYKYWAEQMEMAQIGLDAADRLNEPTGKIYNTMALALANMDLGKYGRAIGYYRRLLKISKEIGHPWAHEMSLIGLGVALRNADRDAHSVPYLLQAIEVAGRIGDDWAKGIALHNLGEAYRKLRTYETAFEHYRQSLLVRRRLGERHGEAWVLHDLGQTHLDLGQLVEAEQSFCESLAIRRDIRDQPGEACTLYALGHVAYARGASGAAHWHAALRIFRVLDPDRALDLEEEINGSVRISVVAHTPGSPFPA
jgi:DNA-binding SARP family transcriptional activator